MGSHFGGAAIGDQLAKALLSGEITDGDAVLADLDAEWGPIPPQESAAARDWAEQVLPARPRDTDSAPGSRTG